MTKVTNTGPLSALLATAMLSSTLLGVAPASATTLVGITSAAALGANDSIDWGQLGAGSFVTLPSNLALSFDVTSAAGKSATVQSVAPIKVVEGSAHWMGNFSAGDQLLETQFSRSILITFANSISAVGTQIESVGSGAFTGEITAFDSGGNILGTFNESGLAADTGGDGSAIFIGLKSLSPNIASAQFNISPQAIFDGTGTNFAINKLEFATSAAAVPESGTWLMMLLGMGFVGFQLRRQAAGQKRAPIAA